MKYIVHITFQNSSTDEFEFASLNEARRFVDANAALQVKTDPDIIEFVIYERVYQLKLS